MLFPGLLAKCAPCALRAPRCLREGNKTPSEMKELLRIKTVLTQILGSEHFLISLAWGPSQIRGNK